MLVHTVYPVQGLACGKYLTNGSGCIMFMLDWVGEITSFLEAQRD
jgi:hypothetical protein